MLNTITKIMRKYSLVFKNFLIQNRLEGEKYTQRLLDVLFPKEYKARPINFEIHIFALRTL